MLDELVAFGRSIATREPGGDESVDVFIDESGRREEAAEWNERRCGAARFLLQLAARALDRRLAIIQPPRGYFVEEVVGRVAILAQQQHPRAAIVRLVEERHHRGRAGVADQLQLAQRTVRETHAV